MLNNRIICFDALLLWQTAFCLLVLKTDGNIAAGELIQIIILLIPVQNNCPPQSPPLNCCEKYLSDMTVAPFSQSINTGISINNTGFLNFWQYHAARLAHNRCVNMY